jgi:hypothetical protein
MPLHGKTGWMKLLQRCTANVQWSLTLSGAGVLRNKRQVVIRSNSMETTTAERLILNHVHIMVGRGEAVVFLDTDLALALPGATLLECVGQQVLEQVRHARAPQ